MILLPVVVYPPSADISLRSDPKVVTSSCNNHGSENWSCSVVGSKSRREGGGTGIGRASCCCAAAAAAAAPAETATSNVVIGSAADGWSCSNSSSGSADSGSTDLNWDVKTLDHSTTGTNDSSSSSGAGSCRSAARVVLLGQSADEQCGGYGRHRTKFRFSGGWQALADELALDVRRLWIRNFGRDDQLIADHGRGGRHPFHEQLMSALLDTPLHVIADFSKPIGVGDKQLSRHALASLGITGAASREKRAIQFGTRIGKLRNKREFGSNRKQT